MFLKFKSSLQLNFLKTTCIGCFFLFTKRNRAHGSGSKLWLLKVLNPWKQKRRFQRKKVDNAQQKTSLSESFVWVIQRGCVILLYIYIHAYLYIIYTYYILFLYTYTLNTYIQIRFKVVFLSFEFVCVCFFFRVFFLSNQAKRQNMFTY